jgi:xanthine dehydrogenase accessory factor
MIELTRRMLAAAEGGEPVLVASVLEPGPRAGLKQGDRLLVTPAGERLGTLGEPTLDDLVASQAPASFAGHTNATVYVGGDGLSERTIEGATSLYLEVIEAKPVFVVIGAGHVGRAISKLADFLDFHVAVIDDREDYADPEQLPEADEVICADFEEAIDNYPITANTHVVMVTRGHRQDEVSLRRVLGRGARYVGMIGSKRRTATVLQHLRDEGYDPDELAKVRTPIGLDIGAESPEEIAVSVLAEVIMLNRGGTGAPMYFRRTGDLGTA